MSELSMTAKFSLGLLVIVSSALLLGNTPDLRVSGTTSQRLAFANRSGQGWTIIGNPNPTSLAEFNSVSCTSRNTCLAVGDYTSSDGRTHSLAEGWNGRRWIVLPGPRTGPVTFLVSISCVSTRLCVVVGLNQGSLSTGLIWNGNSWQNMGPPLAFNVLALDCVSAAFCAAGGNKDEASFTTSTEEIWNGSSWSQSATPTTRSTVRASVLDGVSCASTRFCMAVGRSGEQYRQRPSAEILRAGRWVDLATRTPRGAIADFFSAVSCPSLDFCVAVGSALVGLRYQSLIESWNGKNWSLSPPLTLESRADSAELDGVSCASPRQCVAVGDVYRFSGGHQVRRTLIAVYSGSDWQVVASRNRAGLSDNYLDSVSCTGSDLSCIAVGASRSISSRNSEALAEATQSS